MRLLQVAWLVLVAAGVSLPLPAADGAQVSWDKLTSLVGEWQGSYEGTPARVSYALVASGTALMETLEGEHDGQMITVYHRDGASLLMTHYCSMGNQSRMRSPGLQDGGFDFSYVDSTNVKSPDRRRMTRLVLSFSDPDRLVQEWSSREGTQEHVGRFEFTRKKP